MQHDEQEEQPVSFQELKKQWALKESKSLGQEQLQPPGQPVASQSPSLSSIHSETTIVTSPAMTPCSSNTGDIPAPVPILQKPVTSPAHHPTPEPPKAPESSSPKGVSLLAQQFNRMPHHRPSNGNFSPVSQVAPIAPGSEDPFHDDEALSDVGDSDSETDSNAGSPPNVADDNLIQRLQQVRLRNTTSALDAFSNSGHTEKSSQPPLSRSISPLQTQLPAKKAPRAPPPPPPPPSKKYHSTARVNPPTPNSSSAVSIPRDSRPVVPEPATASAPVAPPILPPRPIVHAEQYHVEFSPQLPPRRSVSIMGQSRTTTPDAPHPTRALSPSHAPQEELRRANTVSTGPRRVLSRSEMSAASNMFPDVSNTSRSPPLLDRERRVHSHRGAIHALATAGSRFATGSHTTRIWDSHSCQCTHNIESSVMNEAIEKVRALAFAPSRNPLQEGQRLWIGLHDGTIMVVNAVSGEILVKRTTNHSHPVLFLLRNGNKELWSLDEAGVLNVWNMLIDDCEHQPPHKLIVTPKAVAALVVDGELWTSSGRTLDVERFTSHTEPTHIRIPKDYGNITSLTTMPHYTNQIFASHDDGRISAWDTNTLERVNSIAASLYGITAMKCVGEHHLWAGLTSGKICVFDTRRDRWAVVKAWPAHKGAVTDLVVDESAFASNEATLQVLSADSNGCACIWDGLMVDAWKDQQLHGHAKEYCTYRDTQIMICSWNIDANKPEKLIGRDDSLLREWLHGMEDPDIIVVGIQEIVDLESKKQTARLFFSTRKKNDAPQDAEELLTHRYRLWHDHLVRLVGDNYGRGTYSVLKTDQLVGLFSCVFVKSSESDRVIDCDSTVVKTGLKVLNKSLHGNKGGIAIRFLFDHSSLCFVNCHLAAGQSHKEARNTDAETILQTGEFDKKDYFDVFANGGDGSMLMDHEHCFLSGDLNYRIDMDRHKVLHLLGGADKDTAWLKLQEEDQLKKQRILNIRNKLMLFMEAPIRFDPTYKYDPGTDNYDQSEKQRVPAWCDRVLYRSPGAENLYYRRHEVRASDHRPISAGFRIQSKIIEDDRRNRVLEKIELLWHQELERVVQQKKTRYVADYGLCSPQEAQERLGIANWSVASVVADLFQSVH